jgi:hypothetical protein
MSTFTSIHTYLIWTPVLEWNVVWCVALRTNIQKDICSKEIGFRDQNMMIVLR